MTARPGRHGRRGGQLGGRAGAGALALVLDYGEAHPPWMRDAACYRSKLNPALWTDPVRSKPGRRGGVTWSTTARKLCSICPVAADCLAWALATDQREGIWGGLDPLERRALVRARRRAREYDSAAVKLAQGVAS